MTVVYVILIIVALLLIIPLFISKELNYEKSVAINAPISRVWGNVKSLSAMDQWVPGIRKIRT